MTCTLAQAGLFLLAGSIALADEKPPVPFAFQKGDRIVLLGDAFIERDQDYGFFETMLSLAHPEKGLVFRNLGWSGDGVSGAARARFGPPEEGFQHLKDHVLALKPTVMFICYGANESFAGDAGLPGFIAGYKALLDSLAPAKSRVVLISPLRRSKLPPPLPDPGERNRVLEKYVAAIRGLAGERGLGFIDLFDAPELDAPNLTTDGMHLNRAGHYAAALALARGLGVDLRVPVLRPADSAGANARGPANRSCEVAAVRFTSLKPQAHGRDDSASSADAAFSDDPGDDDRSAFVIENIGPSAAPEACLVELAGRKIAELHIAPGERKRFAPPRDDYERLIRLQATVNAKNRLYFHRWRPQNETYLFLFRKHEQGQNAREIPLFDPLVEAKEKEIAGLCAPVKYRVSFAMRTKP